MELRLESNRILRQEDALTVVKGCLATVLHFWDRLGEGERRELLNAALENTDQLITMFDEDLAPLRV